ncbi:MAG: polynucleotide adenylyltransferase PcnB, partial [Rhodoferax sp.]|nr:polynucleotide adenylyltransferase PcnB [Rhodoferax sp.]
VGEGKPVAPSFLLACVLWAEVRDGWEQRMAQHQSGYSALQDAIEDVFNARIGDVSGRGRLAGDMREIWLMQTRFDKRVGSAPFGLVEQPRFRAAFDFMRLRADASEVDVVLANWWQEFSTAEDWLRRDMVDQIRAEIRAEQAKRSKLVRAPRPPGKVASAAKHTTADSVPADTGLAVDGATDTGGQRAEAGTLQGADSDAGPPKKRRRRRPSAQRSSHGEAEDGSFPF